MPCSYQCICIIIKVKWYKRKEDGATDTNARYKRNDSVARREYFANFNELADLMLHLEPMEKYEFAMLKQCSHVVG